MEMSQWTFKVLHKYPPWKALDTGISMKRIETNRIETKRNEAKSIET